MGIRELRLEMCLTQQKCADFLGMPLRTYQLYESQENRRNTIKYKYIFETLEKCKKLDEEHGILTIDRIKRVCNEVFSKFKVNYCYLFGSYAKGKATEKSDVDLLIDTEVSGIRFFEIVELLRETLKKNVDLLDVNQLKDNFALTKEILHGGIKIYG